MYLIWEKVTFEGNSEDLVARYASITTVLAKLGGMAAGWPWDASPEECSAHLTKNANKETCINNKLIDHMRKLHCFINCIKIFYIQPSL